MIHELIQQRVSVRKFEDRTVEDEKLLRVLDAARMAPSARNRQAWKFIVVREPSMRQKMMKAANNQQHVGEAPVIIACCGLDPEYHMRCGQPADPIDLAIAIDHMTLAAAEAGLGTCWIGSFFQDEVRQLLQIPDNVRIVELLLLGYPSGRINKTPRKPLDQIVCFERWQD